ncbi:MAG: hypothetical protein K9L68_13630 [Spirochaetales bacterium]|nr:hypothetical protein [Spirochaetales bacterium]
MRLKSLPIALLAALLNVLFASLVSRIGAPLYIDSLFSMVVTIRFGLVPGLITALLTNSTLAIAGQTLFPFVICHILTVLIAAFMAQRGYLKSVVGFLWLGLFSAFSNGVVGTFISFYLFKGVTEVHGIDKLVTGLIVTGRSFITSLFWAGMLSNFLDIIFSRLVTYAILLAPILRGDDAKPVIGGQSE